MDKAQILFIINLVCTIILVVIATFYSINIKQAYPEWMIIIASEPIYMFVVYMSIFALSYYNVLIALLLIIVVVALHMDFVNLVEISLEK